MKKLSDIFEIIEDHGSANEILTAKDVGNTEVVVLKIRGQQDKENQAESRLDLIKLGFFDGDEQMIRRTYCDTHYRYTIWNSHDAPNNFRRGDRELYPTFICMLIDEAIDELRHRRQ